VAKDSSKGANQDNIDTSIDTSFIFPEILNNIKVIRKYKEEFISIEGKKISIGSFPSEEYYDALDEFIDTKAPKIFIKALRINDKTIWDGREKYSRLSKKLYIEQHKELPEIYVPFIHQPTKLSNIKAKLPDYFIVWRTLEHWIQYYNPSTDLYKKHSEYKQMVEFLKKQLKNVSPLLAIHKEKSMKSFVLCGYKKYKKDDGSIVIEQISKDGLEHALYHSNSIMGGKKGIVIDYIDGSGKLFVSYFNMIENTIKTNIDKRYMDGKKKKNDILNALKKINIELTEEEIKYIFDHEKYFRIDKVVSGVIAVLHNRYCEPRAWSDNILKLYKKAK